MKKTTIYLSLLLLVLGLNSCITSFRISVQAPSMIDLPNEVKKIVVIDNSSLIKPTKESKLDAVLTGEQINGDQLAKEAYPSGLMQSLRNGGYVAEQNNSRPVQNDKGEINWQILDSIFSENDAQCVVILNSFDSDSRIGGVVLSDALGQTQNYLYGKSYISIYCFNGLTIENLMVDDKFIIPSSGSLNPLAVLNDVVNKRKFYTSLGSAVGYRAGSFFYSNWVWANREFYNKGSRSLHQAKKMIYYGNWKIAEEKLNYILQSTAGNKVMGRASYNLGIVHEGQGRIDDAISAVEKASVAYNCKKAPMYLQQLQQRKNAVQVIQWQHSY